MEQHNQQHQHCVSKLILAIDIGSSSTRCSVWSWNSRKNKLMETTTRTTTSRPSIVATTTTTTKHLSMVSMSARQIRAIHPSTGRIASVPLLLDAVDEVVQESLDQLRESFQERSKEEEGTNTKFEIVGVGFSSFVMNLVGVDDLGIPVDDVATLSYACNTRDVVDEVKALRKELGGNDQVQGIYELTGAPIHPSYAVAQLRVLYDNHADVCQQIVRWQTLSSCCLSRWFGVPHLPVSFSEASWTGLVNFRTCQYAQCALDLLPAECCRSLPELVDYDGASPTLQQGLPEGSPYYDRWPELRTSCFVLGIGDGACATIGSKCTVPSRISCTIGTSAAARICAPLPVVSESRFDSDDLIIDAGKDLFVPGLFCYRVDKSHVILGGALTDGGSVLEWARQLLNLKSSPEAYEACLSEVEELVDEQLIAAEDLSPGNHSTESTPVIFVPFLSGERNPGFRDSATGAMIGLTRATRPAHVLKSCLEGVTLRINTIVSLLWHKVVAANLSSGIDDCRIIISGKALEVSALWRQMLADCAQISVVYDEDTSESTSRGVACMVIKALDAMVPNEGLTKQQPVESLTPSRVSHPRPALAHYWKRISTDQENFLQAITPLYDHPS